MKKYGQHTPSCPPQCDRHRDARRCAGCGAPERVNAIGYSNISLLDYCAGCINRALDHIRQEGN